MKLERRAPTRRRCGRGASVCNPRQARPPRMPPDTLHAIAASLSTASPPTNTQSNKDLHYHTSNRAYMSGGGIQFFTATSLFFLKMNLSCREVEAAGLKCDTCLPHNRFCQPNVVNRMQRSFCKLRFALLFAQLREQDADTYCN